MSNKKIHPQKQAIAAGILFILAAGILARTAMHSSRPNSLQPRAAQADNAPPLLHETPKDGSYKVLHIMSYHMPWKWTEDQLNGFKEVLSDLPIEYKVVEMDTKRNSTEAWKDKVTQQAVHTIEAWKPDLVFTGDDNAQQYITTRYLNSSTPFVFCAVNAEPEVYGFDTADNVTGVLERMHFVQSVRLLREMVPQAHAIAMITDGAAMWGPMIRRLKQMEDQLGEAWVAGYDVVETFAEYQAKIRAYQDKVDAIGFLGVFEYKDEDGRNVPMEDVMAWTVENSRLPDFAFWRDRVDKGTLCAVTVSGLAQGRAAGEIARGILLQGRAPKSYPMVPTEIGQPVINLARARQLGIKPTSSLLLTAEVVKEIK